MLTSLRLRDRALLLLHLRVLASVMLLMVWGLETSRADGAPAAF
jgi:hypothetical protein